MTKKKEKQPLTAEEIAEKFDGELVTDDQEVIDLPDPVMFDDDILTKNIIIYGIKKVGERTTDFGVTVDYLLHCTYENGEKFELRSNHAYTYQVWQKLHKYKKPFRARVMKSKGNRYFLTGWIKD